MKSLLRFPVLLILFLLPFLVTGVTFAQGPGAEAGSSGPALLLAKPTPTPDLARRTPTPYVEGHVSAVLAGEGLGGGGNYGDVTLYADTAFLQVRFNACDEGFAIRQVNEDGSVVCQLTDNTIYSAGDGLLLDAAVFSADPAYLQRRVVDGCADGYAIRQVNEDGSVVCQLIDNTTYSAGDGLLLDGAVFSADPDYIQRRVVDGCAEGYAIRQVDVDGGVVCQLIDNTIYTAGNQLELAGTTFNVIEGAGSGLDADLLEGQHGSYYQSASNINTGTLGAGFYSAYSDLGAEGYLANAAGDLALNNGTLQATLNADLLDGLSSTSFWALGGNTVGAASVLGISNNYPLEFWVNGSRALRLEPHFISPNIIGGYSGNWVTSGVYSATIGGGGWSGLLNRVTDSYGTVAGGLDNQAGDDAGTTSDKPYATVGGGYNNIASGYSATVPGGMSNTAQGNYSLAAGLRAKASNLGSFIWADSTDADFASIADNEFAVRANGGVRFVSSSGALRLEPNTDSPNLISGYSGNSVPSGVWGATISGGGVSGHLNLVTDLYGTVAGGIHNQAGDNAGTKTDKSYATVGGGSTNTASGESATVGGGTLNTASGSWATVDGGSTNTASGSYATVPGGLSNTAQGNYTLAAGRRAKANNPGCFVWGDSYPDADITCDSDNRWVARSSGGVYFYTNSALTTGVYIQAGGGAWQTVSDRNMKDHFAAVDSEKLLSRLAAIPISTWNYKSQDASIRHMGPMAQDFYAAFGLGDSDKSISTLDTDGVALAGVQGLYQRSEKQAEQITQLQKENATLRERLDALEKGGGLQTAGASLPLGGLAPMAFGLLGVLAGVYISRRGRQG